MDSAPIKLRISLVDQKYHFKNKKEDELNSNEPQTFSVSIPKNEFYENLKIQNKVLPFFQNKPQTQLTQINPPNPKHI